MAEPQTPPVAPDETQPQVAVATRVYWNDPALLQAAGRTPETIQALLHRNLQPVPSRDVIYQWLSKNLVADVWRAPLTFALLREGLIAPAQMFRKSDARRRPR